MQAMCAIMRKLLHAIHGMFKTNKSFDGERFYTFLLKLAPNLFLGIN
jgi:hypothetical protein